MCIGFFFLYSTVIGHLDCYCECRSLHLFLLNPYFTKILIRFAMFYFLEVKACTDEISLLTQAFNEVNIIICTALAASYTIGYVVFSFSVSFVTNVVFRSRFHAEIFEEFTDIFLILISGSICNVPQICMLQFQFFSIC